MGSPRSFLCKDCQKDYYLGYGSSSSWMTERYICEPEELKGPIETVAQYDAWPNVDEKTLAKNQAFRQCLAEHQGHDWLIYDDENLDLQNEDPSVLRMCYATGYEDVLNVLVEKDYDRYECVDLAKVGR